MGNTQGTEQLCEEKVDGVCNNERECRGIMLWNCGSEHPEAGTKDKCIIASNPLSHRSGGASPRKSFKILPTQSDANVSKVVPLSWSEQNPANSIFCPELSMFDAGHGDGGVFCSSENGSGTKESLQNNVASHEMIQNTNMHRQPLQQLQPIQQIVSSRFDSNAGEQPAQAPIVPLPSLSRRPSSVHYTNQAFPLSSSSRPQSCSSTSQYHFLSYKRENEKNRAPLDDQAIERHVRVFQGIRALDDCTPKGKNSRKCYPPPRKNPTQAVEKKRIQTLAESSVIRRSIQIDSFDHEKVVTRSHKRCFADRRPSQHQ